MRNIVLAIIILSFTLGCEKNQSKFDNAATLLEGVRHDYLFKEMIDLNLETESRMLIFLAKSDSTEKIALHNYINIELPSKRTLTLADSLYLSKLLNFKNSDEVNSFFEKRNLVLSKILSKYPNLPLLYRENIHFRESFINVIINKSDTIYYRSANCCGYTGSNAKIRNCQYIVCLEKDQCRSDAASKAWGYFFGITGTATAIGSCAGPEGTAVGAIVGGCAGTVVGLVSWGYDSNDCALIANAECEQCLYN